MATNDDGWISYGMGENSHLTDEQRHTVEESIAKRNEQRGGLLGTVVVSVYEQGCHAQVSFPDGSLLGVETDASVISAIVTRASAELTKWSRGQHSLKSRSKEGPTKDNEANSVPSGTEAAEVNEILKAKYYDAGGITWWWNIANSHLDGKTPHQVWLSETRPSAATIEMIRTAAAAANIMGRAT